MTITASAVNELRKITGAGMMDCKKALQESDGDMEKAIDFLRKSGQKVSAKRADRDATEGAVIALSSDDKKSGVVIRLSCETDFVAKNEDFVSLANAIATLALNNKPATIDELKALDFNGTSLGERLIEEVGKIGEKIDVTKYELVEGECVVNYIHAGNRIGVLVNLSKPAESSVEEAGKDVAMQIAAMNPVAVNESEVPEDVKARELEIGREQALAEGKPEQIVDKIAQGKLQKFYKENTLLAQPFVKDNSRSIAQMLNDISNGLTVISFSRVALG